MGLKRTQLIVIAVVSCLVISGLALTVVLTGNGKSSTPSTQYANAWVSVTGSGTKTADANSWGSVETFADATTGTLTYYNQATLSQNVGATESVILDNYVWVHIKANVTEKQVLSYKPDVKGDSWCFSFDAFAPKSNDADLANFYYNYNGTQKFSIITYLVDVNQKKLAGVELSYGSPGNSYVKVFDASSNSWSTLANYILPPTVNDSSSQGYAPDHYVVSLRHVEGDKVDVTVSNTGYGLVGTKTVTLPQNAAKPKQMAMYATALVLKMHTFDPGAGNIYDTYTGGWAIDNLACTSGTARQISIGPDYEYITQGTTAPLATKSYGAPIDDATVTIAGVKAAYNATSMRYEASVPMTSGWNKATACQVTVDGVTLKDNIAITMISNAAGASISKWWNGWDWVSVFGEDDCAGTSQILNTYTGYDHPLTAYVMTPPTSSSDSSNAILATQSEIALHYPHTWAAGNEMFWSDAVADANSGQSFLGQYYAYASRWDNPAYVGDGKTFISEATPGNKASYQLMFAEYAAGIRLMGRSSEFGTGVAGNVSQYGSWYVPANQSIDPGTSWYPWYSYSEYDLLDATRQLSWDGPGNNTFSLVNYVAENGGVLRVYGHGGGIKIPELIHWIDNAKTNYTLENWKATDGEVASYIYGKWSTLVSYDSTTSSNNVWNYNVTRADPKAAGYWLVPVTVAIDLNGRSVNDVVIKEGSKVLKASDGSLQNLNGKRVMDVGYDVRNGTLYVSYFWNASSTLQVSFGTGAQTSASENVPMGSVPMLAQWNVRTRDDAE